MFMLNKTNFKSFERHNNIQLISMAIIYIKQKIVISVESGYFSKASGTVDIERVKARSLYLLFLLNKK